FEDSIKVEPSMYYQNAVKIDKDNGMKLDPKEESIDEKDLETLVNEDNEKNKEDKNKSEVLQGALDCEYKLWLEKVDELQQMAQ
ncbi:11962_t:CDS:1, partial [Gigaspora rosea]